MSNLFRVRTALERIGNVRHLDASPTTHRGPLAIVEGNAHELAHQLEHGRSFASRLAQRGVTDHDANAHEESTLRIEVAALAALGIRVSLRKLWRDAGWRGDPPPLSRELTERERKCVRAFIRIVRKAMT